MENFMTLNSYGSKFSENFQFVIEIFHTFHEKFHDMNVYTEPMPPFCPRRYTLELDGSLVVKKLQMEDSGMYQCIATNEAGEDSISLWLRVKSKWRSQSH